MPSSLAPTLCARARELATTLRVHSVHTVEAEYDGYGDEGMFEPITFLDQNNQAVEIPDTVAQSVEDFFYDLLEDRCGGWQDNHGSFGTFTWHLAHERLDHQHHVCYTDHDTTDATYNLHDSRNHAEPSP